MATNSHFPALRHLLVYELLFLFLGLEDAQDGNFGGNLSPIWAMKMSSTPNSPISCELRTGPRVAYVQTNPLLPEKKTQRTPNLGDLLKPKTTEKTVEYRESTLTNGGFNDV